MSYVLRYTRSEKRSIVFLATLLIGVNMLSMMFRPQAESTKTGESTDPTESSLALTSPAEELESPKIELNTADSVLLLDLYGIGPSFSRRIVKYRELLGGYYEVGQLLEVYGMDQERYDGFSERVWADTMQIRKINLTTVTFRDLLRHPYTNYEMVKSFIAYRDRNGPPYSVRKALEGSDWPDSLAGKLEPYLSVSNH